MRSGAPSRQRIQKVADPGIVLDQLPRRIILSRKGADATWGGRPSLRLGDELVSLPIPESAQRAAAAEESGTGLRYGDLPPHPQLGPLHPFLRGLSAEHYVHLDPDLRPELRGTASALSGEHLFGQVGAAERHLRLQEVGPGDLFLFFGWFREIARREGRWQRSGPDEHTLWGWLQIAESHPVRSAEEAAALPWAAHHPHVAHWQRFDRHNRLYRAARQLSFAPRLPGAGVFRWHPGLTLTQRCCTASRRAPTRGEWCLPGFLRRTGLTYNQVDGPACPAHPDRLHLRSAPIGQEFVLPAHRPLRKGERRAVASWLSLLFSAVEGV